MVQDRLALILSPELQYFFNSWATDAGGVPLRRAAVGSSGEVRWTIHPRVNLSTWAKGYYQIYEEYDLTKTTPAATTHYALGAFLGLRIADNLSSEVGFVRGNTILRDPWYETRFYDSETSRGYLAMILSF